MFLKADKIDRLKRDKKTFYDKNQIDGEGLPVWEKKKTKGIYYETDEDHNDSENQDQYNDDHFFN